MASRSSSLGPTTRPESRATRSSVRRRARAAPSRCSSRSRPTRPPTPTPSRRRFRILLPGARDLVRREFELLRRRVRHTLALCNSLSFDPDGAGTDAYVTWGTRGAAVDRLTLELWMRRDGPGVGTNTGTGESRHHPLVSKGGPMRKPRLRHQLPLRHPRSDGVLGRRLEEGPGGAPEPEPPGGRNHADRDRRLAPRGGDVRRDDVEPVPRRRPGSDARGRPASGSASNVAAALASASPSPAPHRATRRRHGRGAHLELRRTQTQIRDEINSQISAPTAGSLAAGLSMRARAPRSTGAPAPLSTNDRRNGSVELEPHDVRSVRPSDRARHHRERRPGARSPPPESHPCRTTAARRTRSPPIPAS